MSNRIDLTLEDEDGYNFENVLHGFDDIIGRLRVADDRIHGTAAWCDASLGAVPILERYPLLLAELKRCYEEIDDLKRQYRSCYQSLIDTTEWNVRMQNAVDSGKMSEIKRVRHS